MRKLAVALVAIACILGVMSQAQGASGPHGKKRTCPAPLPANTAAPRLLGVNLDWTGPKYWSELDAYACRVGRVPSIVSMFRNMQDPMFNTTHLDEISSRGAVPLIAIEPETASSAPPLRDIAAGNYDSWLATGADTARAYAKPIYLRFAPEMNGGWESWGPGHNGNTPADFIAAWRHVHAIFVSHGVTNVKWVWAPNTLDGAADFTLYYPGSDVVDVLALDGYNWGTLEVWQNWSEVFGPSYDLLALLDPTLPIWITETASAESGGDKAAWITSAYTTEIPARTPRVVAVVWFNENKETDWRVESSTAPLAAYHAVATSDGWG